MNRKSTPAELLAWFKETYPMYSWDVSSPRRFCSCSSIVIGGVWV
jgi:hypothetical protein